MKKHAFFKNIPINKVLSIIKIVLILSIIFFFPTAYLSTKADGPFIGSTTSSAKVYHYTWCSYVDRIKTENRIQFTDAQDAVNHGYRPCDICDPPLPGQPAVLIIPLIVDLTFLIVSIIIGLFSKRSKNQRLKQTTLFK